MAKIVENNNEIPKFWNMVNISDTEAEIIMYGNVVSRRPTSWWSGAPLDGLFISPEGFLEDFEKVRDKSKVTVKINSGGGDLFTAIAICNNLKELTGEVIGVVDGIAASAASVILMGCKTREMTSGGMLMIHEVKTSIYGTYGSKEAKELTKRIDAGNQALADIYAEATGLDIEEIKKLIEDETWFIGNEAVEQGFCDSMRSEKNTEVYLNSVDQEFLVNGVSHSFAEYKSVPSAIINAQSKPIPQNKPIAQAKPIKGGKKPVTVEEMRAQHPDVVAQIENQAQQQAMNSAIEQERTRIREIEEIEASIADKELVKAAKYDNPCSAKDLAFQSLKSNASLGNQFTKNVMEDYEASGAVAIEGIPQPPLDAQLTEEQQMENLANMVAGVSGQEDKS